MSRAVCLLLLAGFAAAAAPPSAYDSAKRKLDLIESDQAPAGAVFTFTKSEIEAWAAVEVPKRVPEGFRQGTVQLGNNTGTGSALVNFMQLRHAKGAPRNWFLDKLLEGERPVSAVLEVKSGGGMCTVYLRRLDVSSVTATGAVLDFLIKNFFLSLYPSAKIGEPFEMDHHIESIAIRPNAIYVRIGRGAGVKRPPAAAAASGRH